MLKYLLAGACALFAAAPGEAAWHEAKSKHFIVYADKEPAALKAFAEKLERFDSAVREARGVPDVTPGQSTRVTLYVLKDIGAVQKVLGKGSGGVAGFYLPQANGSVAFVPDRNDTSKWGLSGDSIFFHEYTHHLILQDADRPLPTWLSEGFAEFFANPEFTPDGSVVIGRPPLYRAEALYTIWGLPLDKMVSGDYLYVTGLEYESIYGRGWLLTHLLSFDQSRRGQLTKYLNEIQSGIPALKAAQDAFGDLKALDKELERYFRRDVFTVTTIPASKLTVPPVTIRDLTIGEEQLIDAKIRLARGGNNVRAKDFLGKARAIALQNPGDVAVLTTLSQLELSAGNAKEASDAADRALANDPQFFDALVAKGRASTELAKANASASDWNAVRAPFLQANKVDPEAAEPLVLFYRSFVAEGVKPTKNAVDGLIYAVALAPQDAKLRMELIGRLIEDNRLDDASKAISTLAYSPHRGKWHDATVAILEQLKARNQALAKEKWQAAQKLFQDA
jgi:tetratricopeptide (TPR) repeat protein